MKCPFIGCAQKDDNPNFDNPIEHLVIVVNKEGHTHVHGPFGNEFIIRKMADAIVNEMRKAGIIYQLPPVVK